MINKNKIAVFENLGENKKVGKLNRVAEFLMNNNGEVIIEGEDDKELYITEFSKNKIRIELIKDSVVLKTTKMDKKTLSDIVLDSYKKDYEFLFGIGGIDFSNRLDVVSEFMDYGWFEFVLENKYQIPEYVVKRSPSNPLDARIYKYSDIENMLVYPSFEIVSFSQIRSMVQNKEYKIFGYGCEVILD